MTSCDRARVETDAVDGDHDYALGRARRPRPRRGRPVAGGPGAVVANLLGRHHSPAAAVDGHRELLGPEVGHGTARGIDHLDVDGHDVDADANPRRLGLLRLLSRLALTRARGRSRTGSQEGEERGNVTKHGSHGGLDGNPTHGRPSEAAVLGADRGQTTSGRPRPAGPTRGFPRMSLPTARSTAAPGVARRP